MNKIKLITFFVLTLIITIQSNASGFPPDASPGPGDPTIQFGVCIHHDLTANVAHGYSAFVTSAAECPEYKSGGYVLDPSLLTGVIWGPVMFHPVPTVDPLNHTCRPGFLPGSN